jgi:hypothetical protein
MWRSITFCLVVDAFGNKVTDMEHLKEMLKEYYTIAVDYEGYLFCAVKLT